MPIINIKPMSVNEAYTGRRFKTNDYKAYEKAILLMLKPMKIPLGKLQINIEFGFSNQLADCDGPVKNLIDIMQKKYTFNDNRVYKIILEKAIVPKGKEYIKFEITGYNG